MNVELLDHMGNDASVVRAARISYGKETKGPVADALLIDYLIRNGHTSPFAHVVFTFRLKVPIFVARQLMRHHVGVAWNEISGRYTELDDYWMPVYPRVGQYGMELQIVEEAIRSSFDAYEKLLGFGVPREVARAVLPLATYTTLIMTVNLRAMFNIFEQRLTPHAQEETREVVAEMFSQLFDLDIQNSLRSFRFWRLLYNNEKPKLEDVRGHFGQVTGGAGTEKDLERYLKKLEDERRIAG